MLGHVGGVGQGEDLGSQVGAQLTKSPQAIAISAGILAMMGMIPGMPNFAFLSLAGALGYMSYRMAANQEAAKTIKYGGLTEEEAWKLVTLNPAKILHLDSRMGSVKAGKDADLVLWTANPLSIEARVSLTMVEGVIYYEEAKQEAQQAVNQQERNRILKLMLAANELGEATKVPQKKTKKHFHCDTIGEEATESENTH